MAAFARPKTSEILRRQLWLLHRHSRLLAWVSQLLAVAVATLFWKRIDTSLLLGWLCLLTILHLGLALLSYRYQRVHERPHSLRVWRLLLGGALGTIGMVWGFATFRFPQGALELLGFAGALTGLSILVVVQLRQSFGLSLLFLTSTLIPAFAALLLSPSISFSEWITLPWLTAMLAFVSWREKRNATQNLREELEHTALISYLDNARQVAEELNQQLSREIAQRQNAEAQLQENQRQLEQRILDRTRELSETNDLLSQQVKLRKSISDALVKSQTRLSQAIEASNLALWDWDLSNDQVYQSNFHDLFGPREMSTREFAEHLRQRIQAEDYERATNEMVGYLRGQRDRYMVQYRMRGRDGKWIWVEDCGKAVKFEKSGRVARMLGTRRDITEEKRRDEQLRMAKSVFDNTSEGVFVLDAELRFVSINAAFTQITGYREDEVLGRAIQEFSNTPRKQDVFEQISNTLRLTGFWQAELYEKRKNGEYFPEWLQINTIRNNAGEITHYAGLFSDLTERKVADEKLKYLLNYDDLTGLANRVLFRDRVHNALVRARTQSSGYALLSINLDRFRQINESLGHDSGDELLKQIGQRLMASVPNADTLARLAADEFCVLVESKSRAEIAVLANKIISRLNQPLFIQGQEILVSASVGITLIPDNARELQPAMQQANMAVRQAKYLGGNTYEFFSKSLQAVSNQRLNLETELRKALQTNALEVYYQPKLRLASGKIDSVEALVRWNHPERGLIPPNEFIPIAEDSGLIADIGERVLQIACRQAHLWNQEGYGRIKMAVNLSAHQMRQSNLALTIRNVLRDSRLDPRLLDLELTESALMENLSRALSLIGKLRALGINVTIDDFGTGYSSLSYLKRFPVDAIKIDQIFIKDVVDSQQDAAITKAMIVLGQSLKMEVVAEGVESKEQLDFLDLHGCDVVQGFYVAEPLSADRITQLLARQKIQTVWTPHPFSPEALPHSPPSVAPSKAGVSLSGSASTERNGKTNKPGVHR